MKSARQVWYMMSLAVTALTGCQSSGPEAASAPMREFRTWTVAGSNHAGARNLGVGDVAPALAVDAWVRGKPVTGFSKFRVYAIVFWSPTSGPSVECLPHLSRTQRDNEDVVVVGMVATERPAGETDTRIADLQSFVAANGDDTDFRIAFDGERRTRDTWLLAAGQTGIPCVFVVGRDGKIAWIGHPDDMDAPITAALRAGRGWAWSKD